MSAANLAPDDFLESNNSESFANMESTLFELANSERLSILFRLKEQKSNLSKLSRDLKILVQEVHRNINRLLDAGLVNKESASLYSLTTLGETVLGQLASINFVSNHKDYFNDHTLGGIPLKFVQRIGALDGCKYLSNSVSIFEFQKNLFDSTEKVACAMLPMVHSHIIESIMPMVNKEIKLNYILPYSAAIPKRRHEHWHREFTKFLNKGTIQRKMVDVLQVALIVNEKQAIVMFPLLKGEVDMNSAFVGTDSVFHEWCSDYFIHTWCNARPYRSEKLNEV
jgi:predicted transcriptional regulator